MNGREGVKEVRGVMLRMFDLLCVDSRTGKMLMSWCTNLWDQRKMRWNSNIYSNTQEIIERFKFENRQTYTGIQNEE